MCHEYIRINDYSFILFNLQVEWKKLLSKDTLLLTLNKINLVLFLLFQNFEILTGYKKGKIQEKIERKQQKRNYH